MNFADGINKFGNPEFLPEGWFWLERSHRVRKGRALAGELFGKKFVIYRGESGAVYVLDAHCPHMGAHLCDGSVQGESIRCPFHYWKFDNEGICREIPAQAETRKVPPLKKYRSAEKYGLIWLWTGDADDSEAVPVIPELSGCELDSRLGSEFSKNCHTNVVMVNAIDAQHFKSVHQLVVDLNMEAKILSPRCIQFSNSTPFPKSHWLFSLISKFYKSALTYQMTYWWGNTGSVMVGPDFLHFYIIFALRPTLNGTTEGQTILVTKKRKWGWVLNPVLLFATKLVGNYFAKGDTIIFSKINFKFQTPLRADLAIIRFIEHFEAQKPAAFGEMAKTSSHKTAENKVIWAQENLMIN